MTVAYLRRLTDDPIAPIYALAAQAQPDASALNGRWFRRSSTAHETLSSFTAGIVDGRMEACMCINASANRGTIFTVVRVVRLNSSQVSPLGACAQGNSYKWPFGAFGGAEAERCIQYRVETPGEGSGSMGSKRINIVGMLLARSMRKRLHVLRLGRADGVACKATSRP
ncbi:hypothetical protein PYCCODRAFT_1432615 [Trametes coccinea BRFM310]|uniref:Uncharacterized protein n=1 Tax=Trametes coccinea (strain BRFM310) TaxID=1353009 RepID=A0A1Y2IXY3_TRAC3|nr:hypothetical protein PYCCODRAFT_1432615 [Trametes coccinea BRFM310]